MTMRVLLADDHRPTLLELREVIAADSRFEVCALACDAASAIESATRHRPDACLVDVCMPGSGVAAAWEIAARLPGTRIVMLSVSCEDRDLFPALRAGACGYLVKDIDPARLPDALADACAGGAAMPRALVSRVLESFRTREARRRPLGGEQQLTGREWEVLDLLNRGMSTGQAARRICVSDATVRSHAAAAARKLGASTREQALAAFRAGGRGTNSTPPDPDVPCQEPGGAQPLGDA